MARFQLVNCRPVPAALGAEIRALHSAVPGSNLNSCLRTQRAVNFARSKGCTLSSQNELWEGWVHRRPGFNPANPPGHSTHERRNDGVAYGGPSGRPLRYWQVGMDWQNPRGIAQAARHRGWIATTTYPNSANESQHLNFRKEPRIKIARVLKRGSKGSAVRSLTRDLHFIQDGHHNPYCPRRAVGPNFTLAVEEAVKRFQHDHHQKVDGIVGPHTRAQIKVSVRARKKNLKKKGKK